MKKITEVKQVFEFPIIKGSLHGDPVVCATTPVHHHPPRGAGKYDWALHSFSESELEGFVLNTEVVLIVHHGEESTPEGFERVYGHRELVHPHAGIAALNSTITREVLKDIFDGKISNWAEIGGSEASINIYAHGAPLNREAFLWQMQTNDLSIDVPIELLPDYPELAETGKTDRGALIFGLRSQAQFAEWLIKVPLKARVFEPQTISVFMRLGSNTAFELTNRFLKTVYTRLEEDRLFSKEFPGGDEALH